MTTLQGPRALPSPAVAWLAWAAMVLPWLWPWAPPPSPSVPGLLVTWCLTALLWGGLVWSTRSASWQQSSSALIILTGLLAWAAWRMPVMDLALLGGLAGSVLCVMVASQCTRLSRSTLLRHLCWALLSAAALSSGIAGLQYSGLLHQPLEWLSWLHASPNEEAYGQLRQRNQFGSLMSLGLAAWLYLAHRGEFSRPMRLVTWASLLALTLGQVASTSRTGALTWMVLCLLAQWWPTQSKSPAHHTGARSGAALALLGFVLLCWVLPSLASSVATVELPKASALERWVEQAEGLGICESRVVLWRHVLELSLQQPWLGWGWGELDFTHATQAVQGIRFCGQLGHAHNLLLQAVVEWGWPLSMCGLGALMFWTVRRQPWLARTPEAVLGWSWLGVIGVHSLLEFPLWYGPFQLVLGLAVGLVQPMPCTDSRADHATKSWARSPVMQGMVALWLMCSLWASWDYHRVSQIFQPAAQRSDACRQQPLACLDDVVWFHQGRDYALLSLNAGTLDPQQARALAQRVAHFAPEPWVLALTAALPPTPAPAANR